jgi:tRNA threonylcarbamoyladenosine biosynthesis protein TsaB
MSSFRQLLAENAPILLIDACSTRVQIGWLMGDGAIRWASSEAESGTAIFTCIEELGISPNEAAAFVFSDGPGSILGVRTAAMAIRTWCVLNPRPVFSYQSLELVAHALDRPELTIIADARRDTWHCVSQNFPLRRVHTSELVGNLAMPDGFRNWTVLPASVRRVPYLLVDLVPRILDVDLLRAADSPDAFLHEEPNYVTWTPRIHRAP